MTEKDLDERIIQALESGRKKPEELKKLCATDGTTDPTYHRHLARLVKKGKL